MTDDTESLHPRGDQPIIAAPSVLPDRKDLAFVALERTRMPIVVSDPRLPDNPIVLANSAFLEQTGYIAAEIVGRNCRFLQGRDTSPEAIDLVRAAVASATPITVELLNYRKGGEPFWNQLHISPIHDEAGQLVYFFASQMDVSATRKATDLERAEHALLLEVDHRAKNALALVQGIVRLSQRTDGTEAYADAVLGRVDAIAVAHALLSDARWRGVRLDRLMAALTLGLSGQRALIDGPPVLLSADQVQPLAIVLHEILMTARQHAGPGAASPGCGVQWRIVDRHVIIEINETRFPKPGIATPRDSFGHRIMDQIISRQLRGSVMTDPHPTGLRTTISLPLQTESLSDAV